ncbi:hypothetical protein EON67_01175 [archaeon]|nr:MAG: hypothetical protein EON67_01175 [archaeon]
MCMHCALPSISVMRVQDAFLVKYVSTDLQVCNTFTVRPAEGVALILCSIMASACVTGLALHTARKVRVSLGAASMHLLGDSALEAERSHDTLGIPYALE